MRSNKLLSTIFLILVAIGLIYLGYKYLAKPAASDQAGLTAAGFADGTTGDSVSDEFLSTLNGLQELKLQGAVFQSAVFRDLKDSTIILPDQAPGRVNPFAPVNFAAPRAPGTSLTATSTTHITGGVSTGGNNNLTAPPHPTGLEDLRAR